MKTLAKVFEAILTTDTTPTWTATPAPGGAHVDGPTSLWGWAGP